MSERVAALRDALVDSIEQEVATGNVRVILWLADKLKILDVAQDAEKRPTDELRTFFDQLDTGELREFAGLAASAD